MTSVVEIKSPYRKEILDTDRLAGCKPWVLLSRVYYSDENPNASAFPPYGSTIANLILHLITSKSKTEFFKFTGFFILSGKEIRYDLYELPEGYSFTKFIQSVNDLHDDHLAPVRAERNEYYRSIKLNMTSDFFVYKNFDEVPLIYRDNVLSNDQDYYQQILTKLTELYK
jgi:hypothetical protein